MQFIEARWHRASALGMALACVVPGIAAAADEASGSSSYSVIHGFALSDGAGPVAGVVQGKGGDFYGTTLYGSAHGLGNIYRVATDGTFAVVHDFKGADGTKPATGLTIGKKGTLYGLTSAGGRFNGGTAFSITANGTFKLLHSFGGKTKDGSEATYGSLALGADGNLYGAQSAGGSGGFGTLFKMTPTGDVTVLHQFQGGAKDGARPLGGLVLASDGNFYGTTQAGGANDVGNQGGGTLYRLTPKGAFSILFNFAGGPDARLGREPQSAPVLGKDGLLYGVAPQGGKSDFGIVYRMQADGTHYQVLHAFSGGVRANAGKDGSTPLARLLAMGNGSFYGTTYEGGENAGPTGTGAGTIFQIAADGTYTRLRGLGDDSGDAALPVGTLTAGKDGHLYGTTWAGGPDATHGTVYQFAP